MTVGFVIPGTKGNNFTSLVDLLVYRAENQPDQIAYTFLRGETEAEKITYKELDRKARVIATYLQSLGFAHERALLLYPSGVEYIAAFFGCLYAQLVAVPAYPPRKNQNLIRLQSIVEDASAQVLLTGAAINENLKDSFENVLNSAKLHWVSTDQLFADQVGEWQRPQISSDTLAFIQYTSGSTGNPKGVMISHGNLLHNSAIIYKCFEHSSDSRGFIWLPPYHDMGLIGGILQPIYGGFPVTLMAPVDFLQKPLRWLQAISHYKATTSGGPNFAYDLCVQKVTSEQKETLDLSSWEVAFTGAEPIRAETLDRFATAFESCGFRKNAFYPCYGMAETTLIVSGGIKASLPIVRKFDGECFEQNKVVEATDSFENVSTAVGCGRGWIDSKIVIVNPETQTVCPPEQVGEIWVSGASVAKGYWNRPEETEKVFNAYIVDTEEELLEVNSFLRTGDLGFLYNGELFVTGRLKDLIIIRGQNHYPQDIEHTVFNCHPSLRANSGAAFAVDIKGSERLVIVHELERSYLRSSNIKEVIASIRQAVVSQHGLDIYAVVLVKTGSIPKTSSGKIRRHACRTAFLKGNLEVVDDWSESPQNKSKFLNLQSEIDTMLHELQMKKQV
jgi:acyl-CoA synthetase (AMP-forming)/AMP-acid ligase II